MPSFIVSEDDILEGSKAARKHLGRVCVLGLGKSGKSLLRYLCERLNTRVSSIFVAAGAYSTESADYLQSLALQLRANLGEGSLDTGGLGEEGLGEEGLGEGNPSTGNPSTGNLSAENAAASNFAEQDTRFAYSFGDDALSFASQRDKLFDLCIVSPGIPYWHELYKTAKAASVELMSEVEFSWRESAHDSRWIAISGTNGKTTTTALCAHCLQQAGFAARAVGNIGQVCLDAVDAGKTEIYVAEVSSYQLASCSHFSPQVAVLLNITPDHIHWHKTLEAYRDAKFKLLDNMQAYAKATSDFSAVAVLDACNDVVREKVREYRNLSLQERGFSYIPLGSALGIASDMRVRCASHNAAFLNTSDALEIAFNEIEHVLCNKDSLQIKGEHNVSNALAAVSACIALESEVADDIWAQALVSFGALEHRMEPCGTLHGVACYNDSKATNVDATLKALTAFPIAKTILLLGGDDKGTDLTPLVGAAHANARAVVCYGEAAPRFMRAFASLSAEAPDFFACLEAKHLRDAFDCACDIAQEGDIILLSPACASFDEFSSFEERGHVFKRMVAEKA